MMIIPSDYDIRIYGRQPVFPPSPPLDDWAVNRALREVRAWAEESFSGEDFDIEESGDGAMVVDLKTEHGLYSIFADAPSLDNPEGHLYCLACKPDLADFAAGPLTCETWNKILIGIVALELKLSREPE